MFGNVYKVGQDLCLTAPCPVSATSTYAWAKDSEPLVDDARVSGADERTLRIASLDTNDAGVYSCSYDDGSKAPALYEKQIQVVTQVPASGLVGIVLLATICSALAIVTQRRRA